MPLWGASGWLSPLRLSRGVTSLARHLAILMILNYYSKEKALIGLQCFLAPRSKVYFFTRDSLFQRITVSLHISLS